ncbi:molybdenum cofactor guanylyltransferase [Gammaproteobacteria bacterium]|nr:molybdenum cofactor guanylyltransferase [Gammaproteobacteria bacterium]
MRNDQITGLILAGGRARRMGGVDKGLAELDGRPMVTHVIDRLAPQVGRIIINANRNLAVYRAWSNTVVKDRIGEYDGPLAGVASGLEAADTEFMLTVPCDCPLVANDLTERMYHGLISERAEIAVATDGQRLQPVFMLLGRGLLASIESFLAAGERKIDKWFENHAVTVVDFSDESDTFLNINSIEEKEELARRFGLNE